MYIYITCIVYENKTCTHPYNKILAIKINTDETFQNKVHDEFPSTSYLNICKKSYMYLYTYIKLLLLLLLTMKTSWKISQ